MRGEARERAPVIDMIDRNDEIVLRADLPGLEEKDIDISVDDGVLSIRGRRQEEREAREDDDYYSERLAGSFARSVSLPPGVEVDKIAATFMNGVLEVHIPKTAQAIGKRIEVKAA